MSIESEKSQKLWYFKKFSGTVDDIHFQLTDEAKQLYEQGKPEQGYVGLAELDTGKVHLVPCFNNPDDPDIKDTDTLAEQIIKSEKYANWIQDKSNFVNKNGDIFYVNLPDGTRRENRYVTTKDPLGKNTGKAHEASVYLSETEKKAGVNGLVIGFGIFKENSETCFFQFRDRSTSQNTNAIGLSEGYIDLQENSRKKYFLRRGLPQELGDKLIDCLVQQLPREDSVPSIIEDHRHKYFNTPFHQAAEEGDLNKIKQMINQGININLIGGQNEETAIMTALRNKQYEVVKYLSSLPEINFQFKDIETLLKMFEDSNKAKKSWFWSAEITTPILTEVVVNALNSITRIISVQHLDLMELYEQEAGIRGDIPPEEIKENRSRLEAKQDNQFGEKLKEKIQLFLPLASKNPEIQQAFVKAVNEYNDLDQYYGKVVASKGCQPKI